MTDLVTGDTGSILEVTVTDKVTGAAVNLTGATVALHWRNNEGATITVAATVANAAAGVINYTFGVGEILAPAMKIEVEVTDNTGKITTSVSTVDLVVREQIG